MTDESPRPDHPDDDPHEGADRVPSASGDGAGDDALPPTSAGAQDAPTDAPATRVCRRCSTQATTSGAFCPHCGAAYERRRRGPRSWTRRTRRVVAVLGVVLLLGGAGGGVALKLAADQRAEDRERAAQQRRDRDAAEAAARARAAREEADAQEASDRFERSLRRSTVRDLRRSITKDARERVSEGVLDGPILSTSCENLDGNEEALDEDAGTYDCMAVTEKLSGGRSRGYRFSARVDYEEHSYTWRLGD
jgi:hypothetical protein